jgi:hypothetical protein
LLASLNLLNNPLSANDEIDVYKVMNNFAESSLQLKEYEEVKVNRHTWKRMCLAC